MQNYSKRLVVPNVDKYHTIIRSMSLTDSLSHNVSFSFVDHFTVVMDRFVCSSRFYHLEFDKEAIFDGWRVENDPYRWRVFKLK